jgi:hypothetical protein
MSGNGKSCIRKFNIIMYFKFGRKKQSILATSGFNLC